MKAIAMLRRKAQKHMRQRVKLDKTESNNTPKSVRQDKLLIVRQIQSESYGDEIEGIRNGKPLPRNSLLSQLSPILDNQNVLQVGGCLHNYNDIDMSQHPIIMPKYQVSTFIVRHFHENISHQGRSFTDGAIRTGGFWIVGGRRLVSSVLHKCVVCRKLRGRIVWQQTSDLPEDRLTPSPSFTFVGVDIWSMACSHTRGAQFHKKRWALLFTCLVSRAIHIEVIQKLSSALFINALRSCIALRGPVKQFRSVRGTNVVGGAEELIMMLDFVEKDSERTKTTFYGSSIPLTPPIWEVFGNE